GTPDRRQGGPDLSSRLGTPQATVLFTARTAPPSKGRVFIFELLVGTIVWRASVNFLSVRRLSALPNRNLSWRGDALRPSSSVGRGPLLLCFSGLSERNWVDCTGWHLYRDPRDVFPEPRADASEHEPDAHQRNLPTLFAAGNEGGVRIGSDASHDVPA